MSKTVSANNLARHVHFIGIGGSGLSAIARILLESGYTVSGSDRQPSPLAQRLQQAGAQVYFGHHPENVAGADLVVRSSAVPDDNVEVQAARAAGIPVLKRADFLGQLTNGKQCIAVAGTHGKTTTTAMIAWALTILGQDPSYIIGGVSANLGNNAHAGRGQFFVIEADEYDRMFLGLYPTIAVVTNVEHDHPDCYPTYQDFYQAFQDFVSQLEPGGTLVACGDDPGAARLLSQRTAANTQAVSYGTRRTDYQYAGSDLIPNSSGGFSFSVRCSSASQKQPIDKITSVDLQVPGVHNVSNALAALAVTDLLGFSMQEAAAALGRYLGTGRRFEVRGEVNGVTIIDDYAHHPTEIRATLAAARARFPRRQIWAVWQPHTYSRTRTLFADFATAFGDADHVLVTEIYAAREAPPADGFSACQLVEAMRQQDSADSGSEYRTHFIPGLLDARDFLLKRLRPGDVVLVLSAGDADQISTQVLQSLKAAGGKETPAASREQSIGE